MLNALFGDIKTGRLMRLQYLGYSLVLFLLFFVFIMLIVLAIGAGEHIIGGDLHQAQEQLREWFTLPFMLVFGIFILLLSFIGFNLMAKRIRDIGLPGWWSVLALVLLEAVISYLISQQTSSALHSLIWFFLVLIPSNALAKK